MSATDFKFQTSEGEDLTIESAVFQALGAASVCWDDMSGTGIFHSEEAKDIGDKLVAFIKASYEQVKDDDSDFPVIGPGCFADRDFNVINYKGENYYKAGLGASDARNG